MLDCIRLVNWLRIKNWFNMNIKKTLFIAFVAIFSTFNTQAKVSDHVISAVFADWSVRHYFDQQTLSHRFSDAKAIIELSDGSTMDFQINKRNDGWISYIIQGWWDRVNIQIDGKVFSNTQSTEHTFYGYGDEMVDLLHAIASTKSNIKVELISGSIKLNGIISTKGSSGALRWIRVIE